jgi:hypothetical protein
VPDAGFVHDSVLECRFGGLVGPQNFKQPQSGQGAECIRKATSFRNADAIGGAAAVVNGDEDAVQMGQEALPRGSRYDGQCRSEGFVFRKEELMHRTTMDVGPQGK